jgi:hypothetical protein
MKNPLEMTAYELWENGYYISDETLEQVATELLLELIDLDTNEYVNGRFADRAEQALVAKLGAKVFTLLPPDWHQSLCHWWKYSKRKNEPLPDFIPEGIKRGFDK